MADSQHLLEAEQQARPKAPRRACCRTVHGCLATSLAVIGCIAFTVGFLGPSFVQHALDFGIRQAIIWRPFSNPLVDIRYRGVCDPRDPRALFSHVKVYIYNITNVEGMRTGQKPNLTLVGPYRYIKLSCKLDVWWDSSGRVSFKDYTRYLEPLDGPHPDDADPNAVITTLNLALGGVIEMVHSNVSPTSTWFLDLVVAILAGWRDKRVDNMFVHRTAKELLWGYEDPLLQRLAAVLPQGTVPRTRVQLMANVSGEQEARSFPPTMVETGLRDLNKIWTVLSDKGLDKVTGWPGGPGCAEPVAGTDGMQFKPGLVCGGDAIRLWMPPLFRSARLVCTGEQDFYGVNVLRYWPDPSWTAPDTCKAQSIPGLLNITAPMAVGPGGNGSQAFGPPIFISRPHFCECDPILRDKVDGLPKCEKVNEDLSVWLDVEPMTGITLRAKESIMVSSQITDAARRHIEPKLQTSPIIPVFWSVETIQGEADQAAQLKAAVHWANRIQSHLRAYSMYIATGCGIAFACVLVSAIVQCCFARKRPVWRDEEEGANDQIRQEHIAHAVRENDHRDAPVIHQNGFGGKTTIHENDLFVDKEELTQPLLQPHS